MTLSQREPFPGYPPPLTTLPQGLLSMLGLQTNGKYPQHLNTDWLQSHVDLLRWYMESRAEIKNFSGATGWAGPGVFVPYWQVPDHEVWILLECGFAYTAAAGTTAQICMARCRAVDQLSMVKLGPSVRAVAATDRPLAGSDSGLVGTVLRPTVRIGVYSEGAAYGNTADAFIRFVRCDI